MDNDIRQLGQGFYWQDLTVGQRFRTHRRTITEADLVGFIGVTGMLEKIFIDAHAAARRHLRAAGAGAADHRDHRRLHLPDDDPGHRARAARVDARKVIGPVRVGDTIHAIVEVAGVKPTSKGNRAIVDSTISVFNQHDEPVLTYTARRMLAGRELNRGESPMEPHGQPTDISDAEWKVRIDLAACYRLVARYGMSDLIYNHITAKVPGSDGHFLINPFGLLYTEITASCFYTLDWDGNIVRQPDTRVPDQPRRLPDPQRDPQGAPGPAVRDAHAHARRHGGLGDEGGPAAADADGDALLQRDRLPRLRGSRPPTSPSASGSPPTSARTARMVMRNHGLIACGRTVQDTWNLMYWLESACQVQVDVLGSGATPNLPVPRARHRGWPSATRPDGAINFAPMEWPALLRQLDREDPSYKT